MRKKAKSNPKALNNNLIPSKVIENKIFLIRGQKVIFDVDLARLYGVKTSRLNEQVKRNLRRFPADFMFHLTKAEVEILMSHFAISRWGGLRKPPYVFTEHGVAMLSGILNSEKAISVNIAIIRTFIKLREILATHKELAQKINELERKISNCDENIMIIFKTIRQILKEEQKPKGKFGFI